MVLNHLQSLVLRVAVSAADRVTGLECKGRAPGQSPALLSYPRPKSSYPLEDIDARPGLGGAMNAGTAQAVARAGRPGWSRDLAFSRGL
jgi:hypothetical protein